MRRVAASSALGFDARRFVYQRARAGGGGGAHPAPGGGEDGEDLLGARVALANVVAAHVAVLPRRVEDVRRGGVFGELVGTPVRVPPDAPALDAAHAREQVHADLRA